ncbi:CGNR zinc finger domain-containing protein [Cryptosporangium phraense]|uniref:CGNR zinc finger domain-containing protein n=1 Tax=Cryptosporangium phraense TaxID=2593070 RepID=A0A545AQB1_9ACTN|nr:CGNR zinc finger domain-containing protein [Cryptosporangium phraense]TQS43470.1 CGNR zinc finger domain-containing protein [Cryptosporangium phraense]
MSSDGRRAVSPAPGGLSLVQALVNTSPIAAAGLPDRLDDEMSAQQWLDESLRAWSEQTGQEPPALVVGPRDLAPLRSLRDDVRGWITGGGAGHALAAEISISAGRPTYRPSKNGAAGLASLVTLEALLAAHTGTLARLKTCQNPDCAAAFYDRSRNSTRVWHDMKTCGNQLNLRASRARRRTPTT